MDREKLLKFSAAGLFLVSIMAGASLFYFGGIENNLNRILKANVAAPPCTEAIFTLTVKAERGGDALKGVQMRKQGIGLCSTGSTEFQCVADICQEDGLMTSYIAPNSFDGSGFLRWEGRCEAGRGSTCNYKSGSGATSDTITAIYAPKATTPSNILRVNSEPAGVLIDGQTTNYIITETSPINKNLTAPETHASDRNKVFDRWQGCDSVSTLGRRTCSINVSGGVTKTVTAVYGDVSQILKPEPNNLTVKSLVEGDSPNRGVMVRQRLPIINAAERETDFSLSGDQISGRQRFVFSVPRRHPADKDVSFTHWEGCSPSAIEEPEHCLIEFTGGQTKIITAHYANVSLSCKGQSESEIIITYRAPDNTFSLFREGGRTDQHLTGAQAGQNTHTDKALQPDKKYEYHLAKDGSSGAKNIIASASCRTLAGSASGSNSGAAGPGNGGNLLGIRFKSPLEHTSLMELFSYLVRLLFWLGIAGMSLIVIIGGFQMIFSGGDPAKFARGQKTIMYGAIGLTIILLSWAIVAIIRTSLTPG